MPYSWTIDEEAAPDAAVADADDTAEAFGHDIWLGLGDEPTPDMMVTPAGDLLLVTSKECLRQAILRRIVTRPGEWATLPDYGIGAADYVKERNSSAKREELRAKIIGGLMKDPRIARVDAVEVEVSENMLRIAVRVTPARAGNESPVFALIHLQ